MSKLVWDKTGERLYETGVKQGVLYPQAAGGTYPKGVVWNGLTNITESPSGAEATPPEKAYSTINDSPEAITFSWEFNTTPVNVTGFKPTANITIDSTKVDAEKLAALEKILYGDGETEARLPLPDEVAQIFTSV